MMIADLLVLFLAFLTDDGVCLEQNLDCGCAIRYVLMFWTYFFSGAFE